MLGRSSHDLVCTTSHDQVLIRFQTGSVTMENGCCKLWLCLRRLLCLVLCCGLVSKEPKLGLSSLRQRLKRIKLRFLAVFCQHLFRLLNLFLHLRKLCLLNLHLHLQLYGLWHAHQPLLAVLVWFQFHRIIEEAVVVLEKS